MSHNKYDKDTDTLIQISGNATVPIDDTTSATDKVYSSAKVDEELAKRIPLLTGTVDIINSGFPKASNYSVSGTVSESIGLPTNPKSAWYLEHKAHSDGYKYPTQIAYEYAGLRRIMYRTCVDGTWESWREVQSKKNTIFSGIKTKTIPANTDTNFGSTITIDKTSQYLIGFTVISNVETSADANIYFDIKVYDVTDSKRLACFENTNLGWKHNPVTALFCENNSFMWGLTAGHTYDVRMYTNIAIAYRCELWAKEV